MMVTISAITTRSTRASARSATSSISRIKPSSGIRVIIDLVVNHTSNQHPWFQAARRDRQSKYRDYYVWADKKPKDADQGMVFPGVQKSTWTKDPVAGQYYFHRFYDFQ